jgi:hypothetical protein
LKRMIALELQRIGGYPLFQTSVESNKAPYSKPKVKEK